MKMKILRFRVKPIYWKTLEMPKQAPDTSGKGANMPVKIKPIIEYITVEKEDKNVVDLNKTSKLSVNEKAMQTDEYGIVYGVVLDSNAVDESNVHARSEYIKAIEYYAHYFMANYTAIDTPCGCVIVESYLVPADNWKIGETLVKKDSWVMTFKITDSDLWKEIKSDTFEGIEIALPVPIS